MKELVNNSKQYNRIEFWVASTIFVFVMFFFITEGVDSNASVTPYKAMFDKMKVSFDYTDNYFLPQFFRYIFAFAAFLYLTFIVVPKILSGTKVWMNAFLLVVVLVTLGVIFGITDTYLKAYLYAKYKGQDATDQVIFSDSMIYALVLLAVFTIYTGIKYFGVFLLTNAEAIRTKYQFITWEGIAGFVIWMIGLFLLIIGGADRVGVVLWMMIVLYGIIVYLVALHRLIPLSQNRRYPFTSYLIKSFVIIAVSYLPVVAFLALMLQSEDAAFSLAFLNSVFQLFITVPFTWIVYKRKQKGKEEIVVLQQEIGRSQANVDFLRSQINPHFLFNALNTLYGTAIQENAERTGEGVQKLGDMMRFMLQENMQDKIAVRREVDYLNNYIDLQKLRTDPNPNIQIQTDIRYTDSYHQIAPMLLIPFVENAFKHGISFREPSHITVSLDIKNDTLYFDVYNSKHDQHFNDPEKDKSGIGLENVKQRLRLAYEGKHELIVRETAKEFFIHLTLQLS